MDPNLQPDILAAFNWQTMVANAILAVDQHGRVVRCSVRELYPFGSSLAEVEGRKITDILPDTKILHVLANGEPTVCTEVGPRGDRFIAHYFPWRENGTQVGAAGSSRLPVGEYSVRGSVG